MRINGGKAEKAEVLAGFQVGKLFLNEALDKAGLHVEVGFRRIAEQGSGSLPEVGGKHVLLAPVDHVRVSRDLPPCLPGIPDLRGCPGEPSLIPVPVLVRSVFAQKDVLQPVGSHPAACSTAFQAYRPGVFPPPGKPSGQDHHLISGLGNLDSLFLEHLWIIPDQPLDGHLGEHPCQLAVHSPHIQPALCIITPDALHIQHRAQVHQLPRPGELRHLPRSGKHGHVWRVSRLNAGGKHGVDVPGSLVLHSDPGFLLEGLHHLVEYIQFLPTPHGQYGDSSLHRCLFPCSIKLGFLPGNEQDKRSSCNSYESDYTESPFQAPHDLLPPFVRISNINDNCFSGLVNDKMPWVSPLPSDDGQF